MAVERCGAARYGADVAGDVEESADLVEEVARIVGFDRIPSTIPTGPLPAAHHDVWYEREETLRDVLVGAGLTESSLSADQPRRRWRSCCREDVAGEEQLLGAPVARWRRCRSLRGGVARRDARPSDAQLEAIAERLPAITLTQSVSADLEALRLTLMSGLLTAAARERQARERGLWFFELGRRYLPTPELTSGTGLAQERRTLGIAMTGPAATGWNRLGATPTSTT